MRASVALAAALLTLGTSVSADSLTILTPKAKLTLDATVDGDELWIRAEDLPSVNGFELKPEGVCSGEDICVPLPSDETRWVRESPAGTRFNLSGFATHMGQAAARDASRTVWSFGEMALAGGLESGKAPDFALQDVNGKTVRLSDFRGKKVLLWVWASW